MKNRVYIPELNSLRFIFMVVIFLHHMNSCTMFPPGGYIAVSFFFVLSGFSLTLGYIDKINDKDNFSYRYYISKRITRFYPIHWLSLIAIILLQHFLGGKPLISDSMFFAKFSTNLFLLQSYIPIKEFYFSFNSPSWYLCNTLFYSLLFPFILRVLCRSNNVGRNVLLCILILVYALLIKYVPDEYRHALLYISPFVRVMDFVFGVYAGLLFLNYYKKDPPYFSKTLLSVIIIACFAILIIFSFSEIDGSVRYYTNYLYWLVFCPLIFCVSLLSVSKTEKKEEYLFFYSKIITGGGKLLRWAGGYSFTFYMIHIVCISPVGTVCEKLGMGMGGKVAFIFVFTMMASIVCQKYFVNPVGNFLMSKISNYGDNKDKH